MVWCIDSEFRNKLFKSERQKTREKLPEKEYRGEGLR